MQVGASNPFEKEIKPKPSDPYTSGKRLMGSVGWGRRPANHPWSFRGTPKSIRGMGSKRHEVEEKEARTGSSSSNLVQGFAPMHSEKLQGPRISHINQGATVATTMLAGLASEQSGTGPIFQQPNFKSRARALGRPLGYGTVYKFI